MTPAEELAAAADRLDNLIAQATDGPWDAAREIDGYRADRWTVVRAHGKRVATVDQTRPHHDGDGMAEANIAYIAAMNPLVGKALVEHMRHEAAWSERYALNGLRFDGHPALLKIARLINGGETHD